MDYGQVFRFYGNKCWHYNNLNDTGSTRASIDFRVIPAELFDDSAADDNAGSVKANLKFKIGSYFDVYEKEEEG